MNKNIEYKAGLDNGNVTDLNDAPPFDILNAFSIVDIYEIAKKNVIKTSDIIYTILDLGFCQKKYHYE